MVLTPQARFFPRFPPCQRAAPPPGVESPPPPFQKAVEWLDSSKPCWQSRSLFRAIVWPRRRSRPSRGNPPPLRVYFGCSDWSVCVCVSMLYPSAIASQVGEVVYCVHTSLFVPRSAQSWISPRISLSMAVCVRVSLDKRAGPWPDGWNGTFLTLYVHRSDFQAAQRTRGMDLHRFGPRVLRRKGKELGLLFLSLCLPPQDREEQADKTRTKQTWHKAKSSYARRPPAPICRARRRCDFLGAAAPRPTATDRRGVKFSLHWPVDTWDGKRKERERDP